MKMSWSGSYDLVKKFGDAKLPDFCSSEGIFLCCSFNSITYEVFIPELRL
jgi:hypothetical protein